MKKIYAEMLCIALAIDCAFLPKILNAQAESEGPHWSLTSSGCKVWNEKPQPDETVEWSGACFDGFADGEGVETWYNKNIVNETHSGSMRHGKFIGKIRSVYKNGIYEGDVREKNKLSNGSFKTSSGSLYVGQFLGFGFSGHGTWTDTDGDRYVGEFKNWKFYGQGSLTSAKGTKVEGIFNNDFLNGEGTLLATNGNKYIGNFKDNKPNGYGIEYDRNGHIVRQGVWKDGTFLEENNNNISLQNSDITPLIFEDGVFKIPVVINASISLNFVLDSGAADVSIPWDVISVMMRSGTLTSEDFIGDQVYTMANGSHQKSMVFNIRKLKVGNIVVENVRASSTDIKGDLLLGQSFLNKLESWKIDNKTQSIILSERKPK